MILVVWLMVHGARSQPRHTLRELEQEWHTVALPPQVDLRQQNGPPAFHAPCAGGPADLAMPARCSPVTLRRRLSTGLLLAAFPSCVHVAAAPSLRATGPALAPDRSGRSHPAH